MPRPRGRPRKDTHQVSVRIPGAWITELDAIADAFEVAFGQRPTQPEVIRTVLNEGFRALKNGSYTLSLSKR